MVQALEMFAPNVDRFQHDYGAAIESVRGQGLPVIVCTIYNGRLEPQIVSAARMALALFNDTGREPLPREPVVAMFERQAGREPDRVALRWGPSRRGRDPEGGTPSLDGHRDDVLEGTHHRSLVAEQPSAEVRGVESARLAEVADVERQGAGVDPQLFDPDVHAQCNQSRPPVTPISCPFTNDAPSLTRNSTAAATSSTWPMRPAGQCCS